MNRYQAKNNIYKNGWWHPDNSVALAIDKRKSKAPTMDQLKYRDDLYEFCVQKGVLKDGFPLGRTKSGLQSNIRAFITILKKNGLADEFFERRKEDGLDD